MSFTEILHGRELFRSHLLLNHSHLLHELLLLVVHFLLVEWGILKLSLREEESVLIGDCVSDMWVASIHHWSLFGIVSSVLTANISVVATKLLFVSIEELEEVENAWLSRCFGENLEHFLTSGFVVQFSAVFATRNIVSLDILKAFELLLLDVLDEYPFNFEMSLELVGLPPV